MAGYIVKQQQYGAILLPCNVAVKVMKPFTKDVFGHPCYLIVVIHGIGVGIEILETSRVCIFGNYQWPWRSLIHHCWCTVPEWFCLYTALYHVGDLRQKLISTCYSLQVTSAILHNTRINGGAFSMEGLVGNAMPRFETTEPPRGRGKIFTVETLSEKSCFL